MPASWHSTGPRHADTGALLAYVASWVAIGAIVALVVIALLG